MSVEAPSNLQPRHCAFTACGNWTVHESGVCPRCRERGARIPETRTVVAPFDPELRTRTTAHRDAVARSNKKKRKDEEHEMQVELVTWCRGDGAAAAPMLKRIVAIPNGGSHSKMMNVKMWKEGRATGFPDLFLPVPIREYHGAFLELKAPGEVPTTDQFEWLHTLAGDGYFTSWSDNVEAAKEWLLHYAGVASHSR